MLLGNFEASIVGRRVGVGCLQVGRREGASVGSELGRSEGKSDGRTLGTSLGRLDGISEGKTLGSSDATMVGSDVSG